MNAILLPWQGTPGRETPPMPKTTIAMSSAITKDLALKVLAVILLTILTGVGSYAVTIFAKMAESVYSLNEKMAVVMSTLGDQKVDLSDVKTRVRELELKDAARLPR